MPVGAGLACRARALIGSAWHRPVPRRTAAPSRPEQSLVRSARRASGEARWGRGCRTLPLPSAPPPGPPLLWPASAWSWEGRKRACVCWMAGGRGKGGTDREDGPFGGGAPPRESALCVRVSGPVRSARRRAVSAPAGRSLFAPGPVLRPSVCAGWAPAFAWASLASPLRVSLHLCVGARFIFVSGEKITRGIPEPACGHRAHIEAHPLVSAAWGLGLRDHGTTPGPSCPPAHAAAPASPSELRYTPVHPLAKPFWGQATLSPHLGFGYLLQAPEH